MKPELPVICLVSSDSEDEITEISSATVNKTNELTKALKRTIQSTDGILQKEIKRIKPTLLSSNVTKPKKNEDVDEDGFDSEANGHNNNNKFVDIPKDEEQQPSSTTNVTENVITEAFAKLIYACRQADSSRDMDQLINKKLLKYYHKVHPDFINSKSFGKTVVSTTEDIKANPKFVYLKLSSILEELDIRRKSGQTVMTNEGAASTGDERRDNQILRLNKALYILKKRIGQLETSDVDLEDESNSLYILTERYKKRACEIYEKICDITGESKHAHRQVKKPIIFKGTKYPQFNKTMQTFVNRTGSFPDLFDVLRILEHCNKQYNYKLGKEEIKTISQEAFTRIGKSLQKRRKTDLYETVTYFCGGADKDPATEDPRLKAKLDDNRKHHAQINDIINKFAEIQDKSSDININIPETISEKSQNNKENQMENNIVAVGLDDDDSSEDEELETEAIHDPHLEVVVSDDEELS